MKVQRLLGEKMESQTLFFCLLMMVFSEVSSSHCDHVLFDPVSDCSSHALRIGYYPSPNCGQLHTLKDSDGQPNANFARLNDPASYETSSGTQYHEYAAGSYLSIKLLKPALVHGIAVQGSPNLLRYYLRSFQISYVTTINSLDINQPSSTVANYYKEDGAIKQFTGEMRSTTKFAFTTPFFAEEVRVHPLLAYGNRVFRVELYGCYLGRINVPSSIGMNFRATFTTSLSQGNSTGQSQYYVKTQEPNGTTTFVQIDSSMNYTFISKGLANIFLGFKYETGWLHADKVSNLLVQGPINGLQMKLNNDLANPNKNTENQDIEFRLELNGQETQMKQVSFNFGDSTTCSYNFCRKRYTRGIYYVIGTASNDFYQANTPTHVVACPGSSVSVSYNPTPYGGGIPILYQGTSGSHSFTIQFYALWTTTYEVRFNANMTQTETFNATGWTTKQILLPSASTPPSTLKVVFNYTDLCETRSYMVNVFLDEEVKGLSVRLNQTFKEELISPVSYFFKDKPVNIYIDVTNGTTVQCVVTRVDSVSSSYVMSSVVTDRVFVKTTTFTSHGDTFPRVSAYCHNRLNRPSATLSATAFDFRQIPEPMSNFSLTLSSSVVATGNSFYLDIIFLTGTGMNCTITSPTAGIYRTLAYSSLISNQISYSSGRKAYRILLSTSVYSMAHSIQVSCYTVIKNVTDFISLRALTHISGISVTTSSFLCYGESMTVDSLVTQGIPVEKALLIDSVTLATYPLSTVKNNTFSINVTTYQTAGWKNVAVRVWNEVTSSQTNSRSVRIAKTANDAVVSMSFTLSSPQGLPDRPYLVLPVNEVVTFNAEVTPSTAGYIYRWHFGSSSASTNGQTHTRRFSSDGDVAFKLIVDGCTNFEVNHNLTIVSPISDFVLTTLPNPEVVVNKTTTVRIGFAANADCLKVAFGDGTSTIENCKNNTDSHPLNCFNIGTYCNLDHVYRTKGVSTITVTASNGLFRKIKQISVTAKTCYNPDVILQASGSDISDFVNNLTNSISFASLERSSPFFYNITSVSVNCEFLSSYTLSWKAYSAAFGSSPSLTWNDPSLLMPNSLFTFGRSQHNLLVPCCFLQYGTFTVALEIKLTGHPLVVDFITTKAFMVNVTHTDLVPILDRSQFRVYGFNTKISLNASQSYDPDKYAGGLLFTWYCRDTSLEQRDLSQISNFPKLNHTDESLAQPVRGCFGESVGVIDVPKSTDSLEFNSKLLQENHTIEMTVVVQNATTLGIRKSNLSTTFLVLTKETPYFEIRCSENCDAEMNPWLRLSLLVNCYGDACLQSPRWKWNLVKHNSTGNLTQELASRLHSFDTDKDLRMKPNVLEPGASYTLVLRGSGEGGVYHEQEYKFTTNEGPSGGTCSVGPSTLVASFQSLNVQCTNWNDANLPLSYEVALVNSISATVLCSLPTCSVFLPQSFADNSTLPIRTRIFDSRGMYTELQSNVVVNSKSCDAEIYAPVSSCSSNPLRIGYYDKCSELQSLSDSSGKPNAKYARLNHPASVGSEIFEYSASEYLVVTLFETARISGIAMQGSPNASRSYLKSFELWYKTVIEKMNITQPATVLETYYKEGGVKKSFVGPYISATMIKLANPFISKELRIYPTDYHLDKVFRIELYGCYLGKLNVSLPVVVNASTKITFHPSYDTNVIENRYYIKITEPNGISMLLNASNVTHYTFLSDGKGSIDLGLKHEGGWISVDHQQVTVLGPIRGLRMLVDGYSLNPYKRTTFKHVTFSLHMDSLPFQATSVYFDFGNSTNCTQNPCQKLLVPGLYHVRGTASNAAFQRSVYTHVISCPTASMGASYSPALHQSGIGMKYTSPTADYNFNISYFALWSTTFEAYIGGLLHDNGTVNGTGWLSLAILYTTSNLVPPLTKDLVFNYTDECGTWNQTTALYIDEEIIDLTLELNQTFKENLIVQVPYLLKNHSVDFVFAMKNGTSVQCYVTINESSSSLETDITNNILSSNILVTNKQFTITRTFGSPGDSFLRIEAKCRNRLNLPDVSYTTVLEVRQVPELISNFSIDVSKWTVNSSEIFYMYLRFGTGDRMTCNLTSNSTGLTTTFTYEELVANQVPSSDYGAIYRLSVAADSALPTLLINVVCQNILSEARGNVTLNVSPVPVNGLQVDVPSFACFGTGIPVRRNLTQGSPITDVLLINNETVLQQLNYNLNQTYYVGQDLHGPAGTKDIVIESSNSLSSQRSPTFRMLIAMTITALDVAMNFTLSSPQGLPVRPPMVLPITERVNFTALVTPIASGYSYNWQINDIDTQANVSTWSYSFASTGIYRFKLKVAGCRDSFFERNLTVVSPIGSFNVTTQPSLNCVVNESSTIFITHATHSDCIELDFGDGSPTMTSCKSNITFSQLNCFALGSVCSVQHVYRQRGTFRIKVKMYNNLFARTVEQTMVAKTCSNPRILWQGTGTEIPGGFSGLDVNLPLVRVKRSTQLTYNITDITTDCEYSDAFSVRWTVYSLGINPTANQTSLQTDGQSFVFANSSFTFQNGNRLLQIPCYLLHYGEVIVSVEVKMTGHHLIGGFKISKLMKILVDDTDLVPILSEKGFKSFPYNVPITVNASLSYDPDRFSPSLNYTWYCRDVSMEPRSVLDIPDLPRIDSKYLLNFQNESTLSTSSLNSSNINNQSTDSKFLIGCFGKTAGIIDVPRTTKEIRFNSKSLNGNHTIEFTVVVEARTPLRLRRSIEKRALLVTLPLTPYFELRCTENCDFKIDPSEKFFLTAICKGGACGTSATFKWTVEQNNGTARRMILLQDILYSTDTTKNFHLKPNVLAPGMNYTIVLRATAPDGSYFQQQYLMCTNSPPHNGTCFMNPKRGLAIFTQFDIICSGWIDTEMPFTYEVSHINRVLTTVVCRHNKTTCRTIFPIGPNGNTTLAVRVRVIDQLGMFAEIYLTANMDIPTLSTAQLGNFLGRIENSSGGQDIAQFIGAMASVINYDAEKDRTHEQLQKKIQIRNAATNRLARMINTSTDDVLAPLVAVLAEVPSEFMQETSKTGVDMIGTLTKRLTSDHTNVLFRDLVSRGKSLIAAMGMIMKSTSVNLDPHHRAKNESNVTENALLWTIAEGENIILTTSNFSESMTDTVLGRLSPEEEAVEILTSEIGIVMEKMPGANMSQTTVKSVYSATIELPPLDALNQDKDLTISSLLKLTSFNPYFWDWQSKLMNSSVIDLQLMSGTDRLQISNTKMPIKLSIPRKLEKPFNYEHWRFQERYLEERKNFHYINVRHDNSLHIEFKPMNYCLDYDMYVKYEKRPARDDYLRTWTLPNLSLCGSLEMQNAIRANMCSVYEEVAAQALSNQEDEVEPYLNCTHRQRLDKRIDELLKPCTLYPYRVFLLDGETKNGTYFIGVFEKNGTISSNSSAAQLLNDTNKCQIADNVNETSYFIRSYTSKCRFWDPSGAGSWESFGCQVGPNSNATSIVCNCNHLTSFASDFLIAPNPIDMDKVLAGFKNIHDNLSVVVLISLLLGLYALLVVRVRKTDKLDAQKVGVVAIHHSQLDTYQYLVVTVTGARINAGTTANVFCTLNSNDKKGEARILLDMEKPAFQRDQINAFKIGYKESIGDLTDIRIWHDNEGESPGWYLSRIYVEDLQTNKTYTFICEQWLAVELEDGRIDRSLGATNQNDSGIFTHVFTTKTAKDFSDQHLWLSILLKRPHDSFTRVQRVTCCLAMLCLTMLASAMFFQLGNSSKYLWKIGSLVIDFKGIIIGVQSAIVIIPVSTILVAVFRNAESIQMYKARKKAKKQTGKKAIRKKRLPCGFLIFAWFLAVTTIFACLLVVLFYSMQWGNEKSQQFVISILTGFFQSAFIIQPLKLLVFAVLIAAIFKRNQDESDTLEMYKYSPNEQSLDLSSGDLLGIPNLEPRSLTEAEKKYARKRRRLELRLRIFLQDFLSYLVFLMFLAFVVRGYRDNDGYYFSKALTDDIVHQHFQNIRDVPGVWSWVQNHFIPAIYTQQWYNGENFSDFKMTNNQEAYRIGLARIRQVRIRKDTCTLPNDVRGIVHNCNAEYSLQANEEHNFDVGWKNLSAMRVVTRKKRSSQDSDNSFEHAGYGDDDYGNSNGKPNLLGNFHDKLDAAKTDPKHNQDENLKFKEQDQGYILEGKANLELENEDDFGPNDHLPLQDTPTSSQMINQNIASFEINEPIEEILSRKRRALKFKINRKTIPSTSSISHPNEINIDSQYILPNGKFKANRDHWLFHSMSDLRGFPYRGKTATYNGGGYVASLATDIDYARATAMALEQDAWIDSLTRAVFFEFSVYNANLNLFATGFVIVEVLPTGNVLPSSSIKVFKLYRYVGTFGKLIMASEIILMLCLIFFIYKECRLWYRVGFDYVKRFWSWIEATIAVALFAALILRAFSWYEADKNLTLFREDSEKFISFHYTALADEALLISITVICFAATLKVLKILAFFPTIVVLQKTLRLCLKPLLNFALPFSVAFCGFATLGHLLFHETSLFSTYVRTAETQLLMLIGGSVFNTLQQVDEVFGPLFFSLFAAFETCIMLNVFLAIINEGIAHSADWNEETRGDDFVCYVEERAAAMMRAFSLTIKETASSLGGRSSTQRIEVGETAAEESFLKKELPEEEPEEKELPAKPDQIYNHDLILRRLQNKISESFEMEKDDAKYMLNFIVAIKTHKAVQKKKLDLNVSKA